MIEKIENFGPNLLRQIEQVLASPPTEEIQTIEASLVLAVSNMDRYNEEFRRVFGRTAISDG
jgi:hypothetical protein